MVLLAVQGGHAFPERHGGADPWKLEVEPLTIEETEAMKENRAQLADKAAQRKLKAELTSVL